MHMFPKPLFLNIILLSTLVALFSGCSSNTKSGENPDIELDETSELAEYEIYQKAEAAMDLGQYADAIETFQKLESRFPFGKYAQQAQLELIFAYTKNFEPEAGIATADRFIRLNPQHPKVDYAYYLKGVALYEIDIGFIERYLSSSTNDKDPGRAREAFAEFYQLLKRFPNSEYVPDARARMVYLRDRLAAYEVAVGRYYLTRGAYVAAANRGRYVVDNYPSTPSVADGLDIMLQSYRALNLDELVKDTELLIKKNFPKMATDS